MKNYCRAFNWGKLIFLGWVALGFPFLAPATVFTHLTGEGGLVTYNLQKDQGNGWYTEPGNPYRFKLGFKQGERYSANPSLVATIQSTEAEHYQGRAAIELAIVPHAEYRTLANGERIHNTATHKVAISSVKPGDAFTPSVMQPKNWYHGFALKVNEAKFSLPAEKWEPILIEQWWQGSPFHPPVSLVICNYADAQARGWTNACTNGNFVLVLRDDEHDPCGHTDQSKARQYNLGPVRTGQWLKWVVHVRPDPTGKDGAVDVYLDGEKLLSLNRIVVGYNPKNYGPSANPRSATGKARPSPAIPYVDCCLYRINGSSVQSIFLDEILFADSLADVLR